MEKIVKGRVFILGANIDTDQIIPAKHLVYRLDDPEDSKKYGHFALSGLPEDAKGDIPFIKGDGWKSDFSIIIAGKNFGCGSSREHAPFALNKAGIRVVIAPDYARIFYRNSVDGGFLIPYESQADITASFSTGDEAEIDTEELTVKNLKSGETFSLNALGDVLDIIEAGGLFNYAREQKEGL